MAAFTQWFGRSNILFALVACIPEVCSCGGWWFTTRTSACRYAPVYTEDDMVVASKNQRSRARVPILIAVCVAQLWSSPVVAILFIAWALSEVRHVLRAGGIYASRAHVHPARVCPR